MLTSAKLKWTHHPFEKNTREKRIQKKGPRYLRSPSLSYSEIFNKATAIAE